MASGPSVPTGCDILDMVLTGGVDVHFWTIAPDFTGVGGTEVVGYTPPTVVFNPAEAATGGQIAKATNAAAFVVVEMPVASDAVAAISLHDPATDELKWLHDSPTFPAAWAVGESPLFDAGDFAVALVPAS
ncbi:hypothetical protein [Terrabacter terrigena]|uniref:Uncharacterized protein n=1 Tax=Terrabacter terrigena TaxID=574718 RepID=A0ABW3N021_9MICO